MLQERIRNSNWNLTLIILGNWCQQKCLTCKASEGGGGGKPLGPSGYCEHSCSKWGYCGEGEEYWKDGSVCKNQMSQFT